MAKKPTRTRAKAAKKRTTTGKKTAKRRTGTRTAARKKTAVRASKPARRPTSSAATKKKAPSRSNATRRPATPRTARKKTAARAAATRRQRQTETSQQKPSVLAAAATVIRGTVAGAVAAVTGTLRGSSEPDALELLEQEHRRFEDLLKQGEETTEQARTGRRKLLDTLTSALNAHELMEEKVLYPALQSHPQARDIVLEGFQEHHVADVIVKELHEVATDDEQWGAKFKVLKENIEHHIQEEEGEMFRVARGVFSRQELQDLAERMIAVREERRPA